MRTQIIYHGECSCEAEGLIEIGEECECDCISVPRPEIAKQKLKEKRKELRKELKRIEAELRSRR